MCQKSKEKICVSIDQMSHDVCLRTKIRGQGWLIRDWRLFYLIRLAFSSCFVSLLPRSLMPSFCFWSSMATNSWLFSWWPILIPEFKDTDSYIKVGGTLFSAVLRWSWWRESDPLLRSCLMIFCAEDSTCKSGRRSCWEEVPACLVCVCTSLGTLFGPGCKKDTIPFWEPLAPIFQT